MNNRLEMTRGPEGDFFARWLPPIWQKRLSLVKLAAAALLGSAVVAFLLPNQYTAQVVLLPSGKQDKLGILGGLAGSLGFDMAGTTSGLESSSLLYPDILKSRQIGEAVLTARYRYREGKKTVEKSLLEYLDITETQKGLKKLAGMRTIFMDVKTGIITLSATTANRELSALVANQFTAELERYNRLKRKTKAFNNQVNVARRLDSVKVELASSEETLQSFLEKNRNFSFSDDPELNRVLNDLKREVAIKGETYATLTQQYELAKIETEKEIPIVQVLDSAVPPLKKSAPKRTLIVLFTTFFALAAGILAIFMQALLESRPGTGGGRLLFLNREKLAVPENRLDVETAAP